MSEATIEGRRTGRRWATAQEATAYCRMSQTTLDRMIQDGRLTAYAPRGGLRLIDLDELDEAIAASAVDD